MSELLFGDPFDYVQGFRAWGYYLPYTYVSPGGAGSLPECPLPDGSQSVWEMKPRDRK